MAGLLFFTFSPNTIQQMQLRQFGAAFLSGGSQIP